MSVWFEKEEVDKNGSPASMADVVFKIECRSLPVDHAAALSDALCEQQPWLRESAKVGIHPIHVAGSQNGWQRPDSDDQPLLLSKRTRLKIRITSDKCKQLIESLKNTAHEVDQHHLKILDGRIVPLQPVTTLFSRHTVYLQDQSNPTDEEFFVQQVVNECKQIGYSPTKILCGRSGVVAINNERITVRSVMLADVPVEYSLALQENGLGDLRLIGCGLLIPHKDTGAVA